MNNQMLKKYSYFSLKLSLSVFLGLFVSIPSLAQGVGAKIQIRLEVPHRPPSGVYTKYRCRKNGKHGGKKCYYDVRCKKGDKGLYDVSLVTKTGKNKYRYKKLSHKKQFIVPLKKNKKNKKQKWLNVQRL